ncbi:MAG TPA: hypothetical protein DCS93_34860 [Microscillaceae bacterium]|nr:hypothetical protein [Microscillaceae bacterium]
MQRKFLINCLIVYWAILLVPFVCIAQQQGTSITQNRDGITFTFSFNCDGGPCTYGQFVTGDYWVIPSTPNGIVTITAMTPDGELNPALVNPADVARDASGNPLELKQGLLKAYNTYDASLNLMNQLPYQARGGESIYKAKSQSSGCGTPAIEIGCIATSTILTVLSEAPPNNGATIFRPPFHGTWKPLYSTTKVKLNRLPRLPQVSNGTNGVIGGPNGYEHWAAPEVEFYHKGFSEFHRAVKPHLAQTPYGTDQAEYMLRDIANLFGQETEEEKRQATYSIIQKGIDNYAVFKMGTPFSTGAGQHLGKKPPIVFFAAMYDDPALLEDVRAISLDPKSAQVSYFQEDYQIRLGNSGMAIWGDAFGEIHRYFNRLYPREDRKGTQADPYGYIDGPAGIIYESPAVSRKRNYLSVAAGPLIGYAFLQHLMPWFKYAAGDPEILLFADRYYAGYGIENFDGGVWTLPDPVAPYDTRESGCQPPKILSTGITGCSYYGVTWGPDPDDLSKFIGHGGDPNTKGRAPNLHGYKMIITRLHPLVKNHWDKLRDCSDPASPNYPCNGLGEVPKVLADQQIAISNFMPQSGAVGTEVTITGGEFNPIAYRNVVKFNGLMAKVISATTTELKVIVPLAATTGELTIETEAKTVFGSTNFIVTTTTTPVINPVISSFTPQSGVEGTGVTINGQNFSATANNNVVKFNGTPATITSATPTELKVSVPTGATTGKITVEVGNKTATSSTDFTITTTPNTTPVISSFTPQSGAVGTEVTISGDNFSATANNNVVKFNGTLATVNLATPTELKVNVPTGTTTGKVTVEVGGEIATSNTNFTLDVPTNGQAVTSFTLINAETNVDLFDLTDGQTINLATLPTDQLNIRANTSPATVGSVYFYENGVFSRKENTAPYAFKGDDGVGSYEGYTPELGAMTLKAIPFTGKNASGTEGTALTVNITFINQVITLPAAPSNLSAMATAQGVASLSWDDNADNETGFLIEFQNAYGAVDPNATWSILDSVGANVTTFTDNSLGTVPRRKYRISAINTAGVSAPSNVRQAFNFPLAPTNLGATNITKSSFSLSWTEPPFAVDYYIEYSLDGSDASFQLLGVKHLRDTEAEFTGLQANTTYYLRMRTSYYSLSSEWSPVFTVTTSPDGMSVTDLILIDADANQDLRPLQNNDTLNLFYLPTLNVRAETFPTTVGSVGFNYDGDANFRTENAAPYALVGDDGNGTYEPWTPTLGTHTIIATPYTKSKKRGEAGNAKSITIVVINQDTSAVQPSGNATISGELKKWHKVTLAFNGPQTNEAATPNPFADYRLNVTFTNGAKSYTVPGFYAADGDAANTSATSGQVWQVHFSPDEEGIWTYSVSFRTGTDIAIDNTLEAGTSAGYFDGTTGNFTIAASDKSGRDLRGKGRLEYVGEHYLRFRETGEYFFKVGTDAPENTFGYNDIDATPNNQGLKKDWRYHQQDYDASDAAAYTWQNGKGTELLGAIKYLSDQGMNVFSFLTFSLDGDDDNVFPHLGRVSNVASWNDVHHDRFDVSKLAQWEQILAYGDKKGMYLHFKTQETENDLKMDVGRLGRERKLYYRELIARFGHHLALNWNLGEENDIWQELNDPQGTNIKSYTQYIRDLDPYHHNIVIHSYPDQQNEAYNPLLGNASQLTGVSVQTNIEKVHDDVKKWVNESANSGKKWIVANDEQGHFHLGVGLDAGYDRVNGQTPDANDSQINVDNRDDVRKKVLWGTLMAGGAGVEYYYGYQTGYGDLYCQDHRTRATKWQDAKVALNFFNAYLQPYLTQMSSQDGLTADVDDYVFAQTGTIYAIYRPDGGSTTLDLSGVAGAYTVQWYDPVNGGALQNGSITTLVGGNGAVAIGNPPNNPSQDWVVLVIQNTAIRATKQLATFDTNPIVFPNPMQEQLTINLSSNVNQGQVKVELLTLQGQVMYTKEIDTTNDVDFSSLTLNTKALPAGTYLVKIIQENKVSISRVVKK